MDNTLKYSLQEKLKEYKKKFYLNILLRGVIIGMALLLAGFLAFSVAEYFARFNSVFRAILFITYLLLSTYVLFALILRPIYKLVSNHLSDKEAASQIGELFPEIKDKLTNILELENLDKQNNNLITASLNQKTKELSPFNFTDGINYGENKRHLKKLIPPLLILLLISGFWPRVLSSGSERIIKFNKEFKPEAPFEFSNLEALYVDEGDDFNYKTKISGESLPEEAYILINNRKIKMEKAANNTFSFTFKNVTKNINFSIFASGFYSKESILKVIKKPKLVKYSIIVSYPRYLNKPKEEFKNQSNLILPEGSILKWQINTENSINYSIDINGRIENGQIKNPLQLSQKISNNSEIKISFQNPNSTHKEIISSYIEIIKDEYPKINLEVLPDTSLYNFLALSGVVSDDYGLLNNELFYSVDNKSFTKVSLPLENKTLNRFYYKLELNKIIKEPGQEISYYIQAKDNDAPNGFKTTKSEIFKFKIPDSENLSQQTKADLDNTQEQINELGIKSLQLQNELNDFLKRVESKKEISKTEKNELEKLLKEKEDLKNQIQQLINKIEEIQRKENRFDKKNSDLEALKDLLDQIKKEDPNLLKELKNALKEEQEDHLIEKLNELKNRDRNENKKIKRTLELLKDLKLKKDIKDISEELNELAEKQKELLEKPNEKDQKELLEKIKDELEKLKEAEKEAKEQNKNLDLNKQKQNEIKKEMKDSQDNRGEENKTQESKRRLAKKLEELSESLQDNMNMMAMKQLDLNMDAIRDIIENLIQLSFDQEETKKAFEQININDPRFNFYSKKQLQISNDAKIIEDSLFSLANKVVQIKDIVTREVTEMKNQVDLSLQEIKDRNFSQIPVNQQKALTSINNLALLLTESFKEMQQMKSGSGGGKGNTPKLSDKQGEINEKMNGQGKGQKNATSKELVQLANEQALLRKQLEELKEKINGTDLGKSLEGDIDAALEEMKKLEKQIINKQKSEGTKRNLLETRLLKIDKAIEEQDQDDKRKSKTGTKENIQNPKELEEFKRKQKSLVEQIKTIPIEFLPFYKNQTNTYFNNLNVPRGTQK